MDFGLGLSWHVQEGPSVVLSIKNISETSLYDPQYWLMVLCERIKYSATDVYPTDHERMSK